MAFNIRSGPRSAPHLEAPAQRVAPKTALLRPGASLIDALERLLDWDDRGAAFATWRFEPGLGGPGGERLAFRLCWIIAPPSPPAEALLPGEDGDALRRQAEALFQPWTLTQHVGPDLRPIDDPARLEILERPYEPEAGATAGAISIWVAALNGCAK